VNTTVEQFKAFIEAEGEVAKTNARLEALKAEQRSSAAAASLMAAVDGSDIAVLEATIEEADAAGIDADEMAKAMARLDALRAEDAHEAAPTDASANRVYTSAVSAEIEVQCSALEACTAYSDIEKFPSYVPYLKSVSIIEEGRSEWELQLPKILVGLVRVVGMGSLIKWEASYTVDAPQRLTWQSLSGFENAGVATFEPLGDGRCRTIVNMTYSVPLLLKPLESSRWVKRLMSSTMRRAMEAFQLALDADSQSGN
jgi:uncharacterized membrane protein